ncbi:hypothetical protein SETIT_5G114500v2 [Setaria italica]|uniref:MADS-box domain-containing protein n=1 Tax=Setaria italica TaxID=4555 RepID=K3XQK2_SETIT|nr:agamous-like MADS-box protein AGL80 [Setaria italica]RCV24788.1 hypothetical protein SETIT_5G114500v2 [Setaria italica]
MARKKVNLQWISNNSTRRVTHKKRCQSLMKKTSELTTLCGVKACVVAYGEGQAQPEVWPSPSEARRVLKKFKAMPEIGRFKKMQSQEDFLQGRISKLRDQVCKLDLENQEHETSRLLHESMDGRRPGLAGTDIEELTNLRQMVETKMARVKELLQEQVVRHGDFPKHPGSSSSSHQLQASYTEMMQQGWPINLAPAQGEELGDVVCNAFASTSKDCAGPSGNGGDMTQPYNPGCCSGFPWGQDIFSPME